MQTPPKKTKLDLKHPKDRRSSFNNDKWRNEKENSFISRVKTVEGTTPPTNSKPVSVGSEGSHRDITGAIRPVPLGHRFEVAFRGTEELNERQVKQLTERQRKKNRS